MVTCDPHGSSAERRKSRRLVEAVLCVRIALIGYLSKVTPLRRPRPRSRRCGMRVRWLSPHSVPHTPEGSSRLLFQILHLFRGLRGLADAQLPVAPLAGLTYRRCRIPFMVRTTDLRSLLRSLLRITTASRPAAVAGSYGALWRLPRPDLHRQVIYAFRAHATHAHCCLVCSARRAPTTSFTRVSGTRFSVSLSPVGPRLLSNTTRRPGHP
jgi:hypothetical protein